MISLNEKEAEKQIVEFLFYLHKERISGFNAEMISDALGIPLDMVKRILNRLEFHARAMMYETDSSWVRPN